MQIRYDVNGDKLIVQCTNLFENDQFKKLFGIEDFPFDDRIALILEGYQASGQNKLVGVKGGSVESVVPYISISTALMGSGRFNPGRNYILDKLGLEFINIDAHRHFLSGNGFVNRLAADYSIEELKGLSRDLSRYVALDLFRNFSEFSWEKRDRLFIDVHLPLLLRDMKHHRNCKIIYLFRDPRDWLVSAYHFFRHSTLERGFDADQVSARSHVFSEDGSDMEEFFIKMIDGDYVPPGKKMIYVFPSVSTLLEDRLNFQNNANVFFADYERARLDPVPFYADLAKWVVGSDRLPDAIGEDDLRHAGELGSFKHQSDGKVAEGESEKVQNAGGWLRKGMPGEWKDHFSPALKRYFKEQTGTLMVDTGYEQNMDW